MNAADAGTEEGDVVVTRIVAASPELTYDLWTTPEHVRQWWRPDGFERIDLEEMDVRVGGVMRMRHLDGHEYACRNTYRELDRPRRVANYEICDEDGRPFHAARVRADFMPQGPDTRLTLHARLESIAGRDPRWTVAAMRQGWHDGCSTSSKPSWPETEQANPPGGRRPIVRQCPDRAKTSRRGGRIPAAG